MQNKVIFTKYTFLVFILLLSSVSIADNSLDAVKINKTVDTAKLEIGNKVDSKEIIKKKQANKPIEQTKHFPNQNLNLIQEAKKAQLQSINTLRTAEIANNTDLKQKAEYKNIQLQQLNSPNALQTINAIVTDNKSIKHALKQNIKVKKIEMIQKGSSGSVHSINYIGDY